MEKDCLPSNVSKNLTSTQVLFSSEIIDSPSNAFQHQSTKEQNYSPKEENSADAVDISIELESITNNDLNQQMNVTTKSEIILVSDVEANNLMHLGRINIETPIVEENNIDCQKIDSRRKRISDDFFSSDEGDEEKSDSVAESPEKESLKGNSSSSCVGGNSSQDDPPHAADEFLDDDTNSLSSNIISISTDESHVQKSGILDDLIHPSANVTGGVLRFASSTRDEQTNRESCNDLRTMDTIEGNDSIEERSLIGGISVSPFVSKVNRINIVDLEPQRKEAKTFLSDSKAKDVNNLPTTPTSSRCNSSRNLKTAVKLNLNATLDELCAKSSSRDRAASGHSSTSSRPQTSTINIQIDKPNDSYLNSNSDDSLSSDKSYSAASSQSMNSFNQPPKNEEMCSEPSSSSRRKNSAVRSQKDTAKETSEEPVVVRKLTKAYSDPIPSTSSSHFYENESHVVPRTARDLSKADSYSAGLSIPSDKGLSQTTSFSSSSGSIKARHLCHFATDGLESTSTNYVRSTISDAMSFSDQVLANTRININGDQTEHGFDDDTWADCEEGSDDEVCTCYNHFCGSNSFMEDELPSKDVDLSGYIQSVTISDDMFLQGSSPDIPVQRKRKLKEGRLSEVDTCGGGTPSAGRKRMALDCAPKTPISQTPSTSIERRSTPRSIIPTKDNPPPELQSWITQFQRWSHCERLLAIDKLIEHCEPTQVRHMMKVIEPQFQRDFISLLPKELALQVLSYLEPKDLLRAAQTCRSWRFLCDDNLLWKEKCRQAQILAEPNSDKPKRGRAGNMPQISSPWKAAYMRQHIIEMNWRSRPIREPKILKGHDDHVITCLQFYGNRIVSGSDDNTLKVWSAVSGKCLRTLVGHTGGVWSSQLSGNIIISGSTDRTLKVWNLDTGQCIHTLQGHTSTVRCMHLHGKKVVSGSRDATLRVWDIEQGTCLHVLVGHLAAVRCVQYDGKIIVSGAYDYMVKVWNPERQECLHTLTGHTNRVYSLQFDGIHIVSGSLDTSIRVWDAETGSCKHTLIGHQSLTSGMELRENILVSGNADSTVKVWDITTGQCLQTLSGPNKHQSAVTCLQFNSRFVITSSDDGTVKLWDVKTGEFIRNLVALDSGGSGGVVWRIRASDTKLICAVGSRNGTEETKLMVLDFDVDGACAKCS